MIVTANFSQLYLINIISGSWPNWKIKLPSVVWLMSLPDVCPARGQRGFPAERHTDLFHFDVCKNVVNCKNFRKTNRVLSL